MNNPCIPLLSNGPITILKKKTDIAAYLIEFMFNNPGETSDQIEDELISFRKLNAMYGNDQKLLAAAVGDQLQAILSKYYPDSGIVVSCDSHDIDASWYGLIINIMDNNGESILLTKNISVSTDNGLEIKF